MIKIAIALLLCVSINLPVIQAQPKQTISDRKLWLQYMDKVARPVLSNLAVGKLKEKMPVTLSERIDNKEVRSQVTYLEAFGRVLSGIAPWLNSEGGSTD